MRVHVAVPKANLVSTQFNPHTYVGWLNPLTAINCKRYSTHVTRWLFLNCDSYLGTALCLCSGRFSAEARGTTMFSQPVLCPGLLLFVHQSLSWTVKAICYHHTLTRATILRFFPTPRSVSCTRNLLCCSKLNLRHCIEDSVSVITTSSTAFNLYRACLLHLPHRHFPIMLL